MNITIQPTAYQLVENATIISNKSDSVIFFQKSDGTNPDPTDMESVLLLIGESPAETLGLGVPIRLSAL
jgi:hypothetical protein